MPIYIERVKGGGGREREIERDRETEREREREREHLNHPRSSAPKGVQSSSCLIHYHSRACGDSACGSHQSHPDPTNARLHPRDDHHPTSPRNPCARARCPDCAPVYSEKSVHWYYLLHGVTLESTLCTNTSSSPTRRWSKSDFRASSPALSAMMAASRPRAPCIGLGSSHEASRIRLISSSTRSLTWFPLSISSYCTPRGISSAPPGHCLAQQHPRPRVHQHRRSIGARRPASRKSQEARQILASTPRQPCEATINAKFAPPLHMVTLGSTLHDCRARVNG